MHNDYTAYRSHQLREADLVRQLELRRQALERIPARRRPRLALRLFRRTRVVHT
jgi:hypothetical protein